MNISILLHHVEKIGNCDKSWMVFELKQRLRLLKLAIELQVDQEFPEVLHRGNEPLLFFALLMRNFKTFAL